MRMDILLILFIIIVPIIAQSSVKSNYNKYLKVKNSINLTGYDVAKKILARNGISYVKVNKTYGLLTDHYNPKTKMINLSEDVFEDNSVASIAIAAHECGHAIQDKEAYYYLRFRSALVPVVNFTSRIASIVVLLGFILQFGNLLYIGIFLMLGSLLFQLVTLPVEYNASARAKKQLEELGFIEKKDKKGIEKVLNAAALTYVASFLATAAQVLRLFLLSRRR
jgi:Zn-dependent membrane protease YugP